jgi:ssDNA-binding replication factor A large subunit
LDKSPLCEHSFTREPIIGYLHNLSPMKVSANENNYFDVSVQMKEKTIRAVCFSPEKMKPMKANLEASSPVKISNFSIKRNRFTHDDEMHINKRTKLSEADVSEVDFNFVEEKVDEVPFSTVSDLVGKDSTGQVNIVGRVRLQGVPETIKSNGKTLIKQDGVLTNESGSIRIVFWQSDIQKIESGSSYEFKKAILKNYDGRNYITINRQTILLSSDVEVTRDDDEKVENVSQLSLPADAVEKVTSYLCCNKCNSSLLQNDNQKVIKCSNCNSAQLKSKSKKLVVAKVLLMKDEQKVSLTIFDEKLRELYCLYKRQENAFAKPYCQLGDDEIAEFLLIVEAVVCYNSRLNVLAING